MSISRNTTYNLLGSIIPLAVSLVTIPVYLGLIGEARYGVLSIAWLLLGYFGLFDLGLGRATAQRIASLRDGTEKERAQSFWTALTLNVGLGVVGGLLIWPVAVYFFGSVFKIDDALRPEMQAAVPWLIVAVPMATISGVLSGALQGRERFLELNLISVCGTVLFQILPLAAAMFWGSDLGILLPTALFIRLLTLLILFDRCRRHIFLDHSPTFVRAQAGHLLSFGGWVTVTAFVGPIMVTFDRLIIGAMVSAKAVTYYTIPFQLGERITIIPGALASALFPRFAATKLHEEEHLAREALQIILVVMTPLIAVGILFFEPFLAWWIDPVFARQSAVIGQIVLLGFWANGLAIIPHAQLQARGRPDLVAKCHVAEVLPYLGLLYFGLSTVGMIGAAVAFTVRVFVDFALLAGLSGLLKSSCRSLLIPALLLGVAFLTALQIRPMETISWLILIAGNMVVTIAWAWQQAPATLRIFVTTQLKFLFGGLKRPVKIDE